MPLPRPAAPDPLRPTAEVALATWAARVRADRDQVERLRETDDPADFYAPVADRFRADPRRTDDGVLAELLREARPGDTWLDIGAGGGRYALPLALHVRRVIAVEPSPGMRAVLAAGAAELGVENVVIDASRWPPEPGAAGEGSTTDVGAPGAAVQPVADVALLAHVGYDIEAIGPFLDAVESATRRACVAVVSEGAMTTVATLFWAPVHGEPKAVLPALPELVALLLARGRLPEIRLAERAPRTFGSFDEVLLQARRQLWVRPGSDKDRRLTELVHERTTERDGRWSLDWSVTRIGVVTWEPRDPA